VSVLINIFSSSLCRVGQNQLESLIVFKQRGFVEHKFDHT